MSKRAIAIVITLAVLVVTAIVVVWVVVGGSVGGGHVIGGLGVAFAAFVTVCILLGAGALGVVGLMVWLVVRALRRRPSGDTAASP